MTIRVRVIPNAGRDGFAGMREDAVVVKVGAPAVDGKANRAATRYLARAFAVPVSRVRLVSGEKSRHKKFEIVGLSVGEGRTRLATLLKNTP